MLRDEQKLDIDGLILPFKVAQELALMLCSITLRGPEPWEPVSLRKAVHMIAGVLTSSPSVCAVYADYATRAPTTAQARPVWLQDIFDAPINDALAIVCEAFLNGEYKGKRAFMPLKFERAYSAGRTPEFTELHFYDPQGLPFFIRFAPYNVAPSIECVIVKSQFDLWGFLTFAEAFLERCRKYVSEGQRPDIIADISPDDWERIIPQFEKPSYLH